MVQPDLTTSWPNFIYALLAIFVAASGWFAAWKNRKKPESDIELQDAQTQKTLVEAHRIVVDDTIRALADSKKTNEVQEAENERLQSTVMALRSENERVNDENDRLRGEIRRLKGNGKA